MPEALFHRSAPKGVGPVPGRPNLSKGFKRGNMGDSSGSRRPAAKFNGKKILHQRTLKGPVECTSIALHCGDMVSMTLRPGEAGSGIVFRRTDLAGSSVIPATWDRVTDTRMSTTVGNEDGATVSTIEHLMAALRGCGIDNAVIDVTGPEVPIMDGSAAPFVALIERAGVVRQAAPLRVIRVRKAVAIDEGKRFASLTPGTGFSIGFEIEFNCAAVSRQTISIGLINGNFKKEIAPARTFGFLHELERLRAEGLAQGGSLDNAVVVSGDKVLNEGGLRFEDEFVRHKVLDAVGDLYLAGAPIIGRFHGVRSGHGITNQLLRALFADADAWCYDVADAGVIDEQPVDGAWAEEPAAAAAATA